MTEKQEAFVEYYLSDPLRNASRAAARAGYSWPGRQGHRLLQHPEINAVVKAENERLLEEARERYRGRTHEQRLADYEAAKAAMEDFWESSSASQRRGIPRIRRG